MLYTVINMVIPGDELVGINEIAALAGVSRQAESNWRTRARDFPKPIAELKAGPVFQRSQIRSWLRRRKVPMAHVISTINLKGGVGKTLRRRLRWLKQCPWRRGSGC